jgi:light-regulated signal transduction histidine kinase (bacteriophytochrome)
MRAMAWAVFHELLPSAPPTLDFQLTEIPEALADASLIRQVWRNLLSNAIKFSSRSAHPVIRVSCAQGEEGCVYTVEDNGVGFDMRYANKLFGVFQRLHSTREFEGTGVGLAIVQRIVNRHFGQIWAESDVGQGARFYFTLNWRSSYEPDARPDRGSPAGGG